MSHHLDSPAARDDVRLDITDMYVFRGERGTVFVMNVNHSIAPEVTGKTVPAGFHHEAQYDFKIDTDGDAVEDLTYRLTFGELGTAGNQTVELRRLTGADAPHADAPHADAPHADAPGTVVARGVTGRSIATADGLRLWTGRAGDPFWIEPTVLAAIGHAFADGTRADLSSWNPAEAVNRFAGHTVYSIVMEVPDDELVPAVRPGRQVHVWARTNLATDAGGWRQINRFGHPMIHPLFTQLNGELGDQLNITAPADDTANYGKTIADAISAVVAAYGTAEDPQAYGAAVAARLFPNVLPYTIGTPAVYGFNEFNGRSLTDNAPDVMFSLATNTAFTIGLTKDAITAKPAKQFPYVPSAG
jgi:Domain of unknown function (DUF4331)